MESNLLKIMKNKQILRTNLLPIFLTKNILKTQFKIKQGKTNGWQGINHASVMDKLN